MCIRDRLKDGLAVLTFDESFATTAELALPVCRALGVPFSIFVTTSHLDDGVTLWDEAVRSVVERAAPSPLAVPWIDRVLKTDTRKNRASAVHRLLLSLASLDEERLHRRLDDLFSRWGGRPAVDPLDSMLDAARVQSLAREPLVSFGAHGHTHVSLANCTDAVLARELEEPRARLRALAGSSFADVVSYPFGRVPYVDERVVHAARAAGYLAGQACADGGVPITFEQATCTGDRDATALAIQAFRATGRSAAAAKAANWLRAAGAPANTNSAGLTAAALDLVGGAANVSAAASTRSYVRTLQQGCAAPFARRGAIAFDDSGFVAATAPRATTQAVLGLTPANLATLTSAGSIAYAPTLACS